ncbi:hypothetical protein DB30_00148 [Enhygromyxa salina]|uniref:Uncharacterized protein n=1 Tax=Enhygromyxa salina TaxID=215803 RepID=A0A0C1ZPW3_9BACT|nr:hypothetical protein [Enhygromyxa salina]KIG19639.1 hypothetical protein DB30_00148 [Enhygromyxa salina]
MLQAKTASIVHDDPREAGLEIVEELLEQLERPPDLVNQSLEDRA